MPLTARDYENIINFLIDINGNFHDIENAALISLKERFGIHLTSYTVFNVDVNGKTYVSKCISNYFRESDSELYKKSMFQTDPVFLNSDMLRSANANKYVYTMEGIGNVTPSRSQFEKYLARHNIGYEAIIDSHAVSNIAVHSLCIFKTIDNGPFTEAELELYNYIGKVFRDTMVSYREYVWNKKRTAAHCLFLDGQPAGIAFLDQHQRVLDYNQQFFAMATQISDQNTVEDMADDLLRRTAREQKKMSVNMLTNYVIDDYTITVQKRPIKPVSDMEIITILTIAQTLPAKAAQRQSALLLDYDLTPREAEVASCMLDGLNNTQIAEQLCVSISTVKTHIGNVFQKLEVTSRKELLKKLS